MASPWALVFIDGSADPLRQVGGLSLALRLALDAQATGASAIACQDLLARSGLQDDRLTIPVLDEVPAGWRQVQVAPHWVVHREALALAAEAARAAPICIHSFSPKLATAYAFQAHAVDDGGTAALAERVLFRSLRKEQDGWTSRWLNRYISLSVSRLLARTPLHPNHISVGILVIGLLGAWWASRGGYLDLVIGAALFQAQSILDGCDGEVSRVTHRGSLIGQWLDTIGDDLTNYAFFTGAAWGVYRSSGSAWYLWAGLVVAAAGTLASAIEYRYLYRIGSGDLARYPITEGSADDGGLVVALQPLFKRDTFVLLTLLAALLGQLGPMLFVFAAAAVGILINVLKAEWRLKRSATSASATGGGS